MGLIKRNNIRSYSELAVADEVEVELEKKVEEMIKNAEKRAIANNRRTILARDL